MLNYKEADTQKQKMKMIVDVFMQEKREMTRPEIATLMGSYHTLLTCKSKGELCDWGKALEKLMKIGILDHPRTPTGYILKSKFILVTPWENVEVIFANMGDSGRVRTAEMVAEEPVYVVKESDDKPVEDIKGEEAVQDPKVITIEEGILDHKKGILLHDIAYLQLQIDAKMEQLKKLI